MSFFDELDSIELLEQNAEEAARIEQERAEALLLVYRRVAATLHTRLANLPPESFSAQQVRVVVLQLEAAIIALSERLRGEADEGARIMSRLGMMNLQMELDAMSQYFTGSSVPINTDINILSTQFAERRINTYEASINTYSNALRTQISIGLQDSVVAKDSAETIIDKIGTFFEAEEWRLRRIVRTELMGIYSGAKIPAMLDIRNKQMPSLKKTLFQPMDFRTGADSLWLDDHPLVVEVDQPFRYEWPLGSGKFRTFMHPPDRPNDRSILIPYSDEWR